MRKIIEMIKEKKLYVIIGSIILLITIGGFIYYEKFLNKEEKIIKEEITIEEEEKEEKKEEVAVITYLYIDIKGAVINPGVYKIESNSRIIDVINLAGGLTKQADTSLINLSKKISDEMCILINTKSEVWKLKQEGKNIIKENSCDIDNSDKESITNKISINNGTKEQLMNLSGLGESKALAIISYREEHGLFKTIEDLKNVSGIGDATFDKIKENITL